MKNNRAPHSIALIVLALSTVLFLSTFLVTCFTGRQFMAAVEPDVPQEETVPPVSRQEVEIIEAPAPPYVAYLPDAEVEEVSTDLGESLQAERNENPGSVGLPSTEEGSSTESMPSIDPVGVPVFVASETEDPVLPAEDAVPAIPPAPAVASATAVPMVPEVPSLYLPTVYTQEDYDNFVSPMLEQSAEEEEEDPFADFFVSGEDSTISFEDGFYYLSLYVNDEYMGDIESEFQGGVQSLNSSELGLFIGDYITEETYQRLFGDKVPYLSIQELNDRGVDTSFDSSAFTVSMQFDVEEMPVRSISVTGGSVDRRETYSLSGAVVLEPTVFSMVTSLSFYANLDYDTQFTELEDRSISLSVNHSIALWDLGFDVSYSFSADSAFSFGSWVGFYDFLENSQRLSFGNVGSNLSSIDSDTYDDVTSVGVSFEKDYSYGTDSALGNQYEYNIVLVEDSTVSIEINGKTVYEKLLSAGTYRMKDFVFTQGMNLAKVTITPEAHPDNETIKYFELGYDYRLLGKGDTLYGFSLSVPRVYGTEQSGVVNLPWFDDHYISYYLANWTASYQQQIGLTNSFTFASDLSVTPGAFSGTVNGILASVIGTTQLQLTLGLDEEDVDPSYYATLTHRFNVPYDSNLGTLSIGLSYSAPSITTESYDDGDTATTYLVGNLSYSGKFTDNIRYALSGAITKYSDEDAPSWSASLSTGFSVSSNLSVSASLSASATYDDASNPTVTAQITGSYSFGSKLSASSTSSYTFDSQEVSSSASLSYKATDSDSMSLSLSGVDYQSTEDQTLYGSWTHSGDYFWFNVMQSIYDSYSTMSTTVSMYTNIAYAGGAFGIAQSINEAFLLVKPVGEMKDAEISVAQSLDSSPTYLDHPLGSALYNGISTNTRNSIVVYGSGSAMFGAGVSNVYELTPRSRKGYVVRIDLPVSYTVTGLLFQEDQTPYDQYSSPVYDVETDSEGNEILTPDETLYLFTDIDGRYILSEVSPGTYLFDLQVGDLWYAVRFTVPEPENGEIGEERVLQLEDFWVSDPKIQERLVVQDESGEQVEEETDVFGTELAVGYDATVTLDIEKRVDEESFWAEVFPPFDEDFSEETLPAETTDLTVAP
jgi:outer membrane usher protein